jgi:hypothetical protein
MAISVCAAVVFVPVASADDSVIHTLGSSAELVNGDVVQAWTIKNLKPSTDTISYPVIGTLWEAEATDTAVQGSVQPIVPNLNARASNGRSYRVLFGVATPQGLNPTALAQGQQATGKVYFDVTGDAPNSVVYSAGGQDLAVWVQAAPPAPWSSSDSRGAGGSSAAAPGDPGTAIVPGSKGPSMSPSSMDTTVPDGVGTPVAGRLATPPMIGSAATAGTAVSP